MRLKVLNRQRSKLKQHSFEYFDQQGGLKVQYATPGYLRESQEYTKGT